MKTKKADLDSISGQIEALARITNDGFERIDKRFEGNDTRLERLEDDVTHIKNDVNFLRHNFVNREEFDNVLVRLRFLERRVGVK